MCAHFFFLSHSVFSVSTQAELVLYELLASLHLPFDLMSIARRDLALSLRPALAYYTVKHIKKRNAVIVVGFGPNRQGLKGFFQQDLPFSELAKSILSFTRKKVGIG